LNYESFHPVNDIFILRSLINPPIDENVELVFIVAASPVFIVTTTTLIGGNAPVQSYTVAFYAYLGKNELNIALHHSFIFDVVIANLGNGYNKHTGAFIVPRTKHRLYAEMVTDITPRNVKSHNETTQQKIKRIIINHILTNFHLFYYDAYYN
jgi:hypothetical protein